LISLALPYDSSFAYPQHDGPTFTSGLLGVNVR
jgi:hypothetical protein